MIRLQELELVFGHTDELTDGWTHRRDVGNSILDVIRNKESFLNYSHYTAYNFMVFAN